jgi:hypothetical protein
MADDKPKQIVLDFEGKTAEGGEKSEPAEKAEDIQVIIGFGLLSKRKKIAETLSGLTYFEGGQKPLYADTEGVRENLYIKSTDFEKARKKLIELLGDKKAEITKSENAFSGKPQLLIQKKEKPVEGSEQTESVKREQFKPVQGKSSDDRYDPDDVYWPQWK